MTKTLHLQRSIAIARPVELVRCQFADIAHHAETAPHDGVSFEIISDDGAVCRYRQVTSIGPIRLRQEIELASAGHGPLVNRVISGTLAGGEIRFDIDALDAVADATRVTATVRAELTGIHALVRGRLERQIARSLDRALAEDRDDLESGSYADAASRRGSATPAAIGHEICR